MSTRTRDQFIRYTCTGVVLNVGGYLVYLWLTSNRLGPKLAATICFAGGVAAGFLLNRNWTFRDATSFRGTFPKYVIAYLIAYTVNMLGLYVFIDLLHAPHQIVQAALIVALAAGLFIAQRFWIFGKAAL